MISKQNVTKQQKRKKKRKSDRKKKKYQKYQRSLHWCVEFERRSNFFFLQFTKKRVKEDIGRKEESRKERKEKCSSCVCDRCCSFALNIYDISLMLTDFQPRLFLFLIFLISTFSLCMWEKKRNQTSPHWSVYICECECACLVYKNNRKTK